MDEAEKDTLISRFRAYLDGQNYQCTASDGNALQEPGDRETDLYTLFTELLGLKNEVKLESRQVKAALHEFKTAFDSVQMGYNSLSKEIDAAREQRKVQQRELIRPLLLEVLDLRDRLEAGAAALRAHTPSRLFRLCRRESQLLAGLRAGHEITLRRLDQLLEARRVLPVEVMDKPLDPATMRAAEIEHRDELEGGIVTGELRRGYTFEGELLRTAEVKVNKRKDTEG